jgi:hypothetical protein
MQSILLILFLINLIVVIVEQDIQDIIILIAVGMCLYLVNETDNKKIEERIEMV